MHHVQWIKLKVVTLIKPGTDKVIEPQSGSPGEGQRIDHELGDGLFSDGVRLVVEDMDPAITDLEEINVAGERGPGERGMANPTSCCMWLMSSGVRETGTSMATVTESVASMKR